MRKLDVVSARRPDRRKIQALLLGGLLITGCAGSAELVTSMAPDQAGVTWFECGGGGVWPKGCEASLVWGDYEKGASGWFVRAPGGYLFPRHEHTSEERILVIRGRITGSVNGAKETMVTPGMYWGFAGKAVHWARCEDPCLMYITYDKAFDLTFR
ncbi:MAG TPA: cupin domain-containing protein [Burkholderiales bacterium]|nr:cupin domain-containing protein [Burkholderiales bacterium]